MQCPPPQDRAPNPNPNPSPIPNPNPHCLQEKVAEMKAEIKKQLEEGGNSKKSWKETTLCVTATADELADQLNSTSIYVSEYNFRKRLNKKD